MFDLVSKYIQYSSHEMGQFSDSKTDILSGPDNSGGVNVDSDCWCGQHSITLSLSDCVLTSVDVAEVGDVRHLLQK